MVDRIVPRSPRRVLDVASGTAGVALQLADRTNADVVGVDLTLSMLKMGQRNVSQAHKTRRVQLVNGRAEALPFPDGSFDALTFTYLFRYVDDPQATLNELARVVRPGGARGEPRVHGAAERFWRGLWWGYTRLRAACCGARDGRPGVVQGGTFSRPEHLAAVSGAPRFADGRRLAQAGFEDVGTRVMSLGGGLVMWGRRAGG